MYFKYLQLIKFYKIIDGYWQEKSDGSLIGRHEANTWLAIHQLMLNPELGKYYQVTDYAKGQFMQVSVQTVVRH